MNVLKALLKPTAINQYCLACGKKIREEGCLEELFYCNDVLCKNCRGKLAIYTKRIDLMNITVLSFYPYEGLIRELLIQYKEYNDEALYPVFFFKIKEYIAKKYADYYLVPIPSSRQAIRRRGFNHLIKMISVIDLPILEVFEKKRNIDQKNTLIKNRKNIRNNIRIINTDKLYGKNVLLIDDILTTGATIQACYNMLKEYKCHIKAITLCYNTKKMHKIDKFVYKTIYNLK